MTLSCKCELKKYSFVHHCISGFLRIQKERKRDRDVDSETLYRKLITSVRIKHHHPYSNKTEPNHARQEQDQCCWCYIFRKKNRPTELCCFLALLFTVLVLPFSSLNRRARPEAKSTKSWRCLSFFWTLSNVKKGKGENIFKILAALP